MHFYAWFGPKKRQNGPPRQIIPVSLHQKPTGKRFTRVVEPNILNNTITNEIAFTDNLNGDFTADWFPRGGNLR